MLKPDDVFMKRCITLAEKGLGRVSPNPMVGCVIAHNNTIIGEGWHRRYGEAHAEVNAIDDVECGHGAGILTQSTLYVSLEPCAHFGKTPPCSDLIIRKRIPRVIIGCTDTYKDVNGQGIRKLLDAGVDVTLGILEAECRELNKRFFTYYEKQRPYIILKWAESEDGFMVADSGEKQQISGYAAQVLLHKWRTEEDAFMVGTRTLLQDNPRLTARLWQGKNPVRVTIDNNLQASADLHLFDGETETIVFHTTEDTAAYAEKAKLIRLPENGSVSDMAKALYDLNIQSLVVEGGPILLQSFADAGLWDEARIFRSKRVVLDSGMKAPDIKGDNIQTLDLDEDILTVIRNKGPLLF